jgi:hypothetical protein
VKGGNELILKFNKSRTIKGSSMNGEVIGINELAINFDDRMNKDEIDGNFIVNDIEIVGIDLNVGRKEGESTRRSFLNCETELIMGLIEGEKIEESATKAVVNCGNEFLLKASD